MSNMMIYAQKGAVGGNVESVWGHEMQVCTIDSSNEKAVAAAKANGYSNNPNDIIEQIETKKLEAENKVMKNKLSNSDGNKRIKELEEKLEKSDTWNKEVTEQNELHKSTIRELNEEVTGLKSKLAIYEESKDVNGDGVVSYDEMTIAELSELLKQRDVEHSKRDGKDALVKLATDSE